MYVLQVCRILQSQDEHVRSWHDRSQWPLSTLWHPILPLVFTAAHTCTLPFLAALFLDWLLGIQLALLEDRAKGSHLFEQAYRSAQSKTEEEKPESRTKKGMREYNRVGLNTRRKKPPFAYIRLNRKRRRKEAASQGRYQFPAISTQQLIRRLHVSAILCAGA